MSFTLDDRSKLRAAFFRFLNTDDTDFALLEQDVESYHHFIQHGLWSAQDYVIRFVDAGRWLTSYSVPAWSGSESTDGGTYFALPADFLLLAGDDDPNFSALREPNGRMWGSLIRWQNRFTHQGGPRYYLLNERLYKVIGAQVPSSLVLDYHHRHATLASDATVIDFPLHWRPLIVAFACAHAKSEDWLPGGVEMMKKIDANLLHWKGEVARGRAKSHTPARMRSTPVLGPNRFIR